MTGQLKDLTFEFLNKEYIDNRKTIAQISKENGWSKSCITYWLDKYSIPRRGRGQNLIDLTGMTFGRLTVLQQAERQSKYTFAKWKCQCECGKIRIIHSNSLRKGYTRSCGCYSFDISYQGFEQLSGQYWSRIKKGAKSRGLDFNLSIEEAWELFVRQGKRCNLTGLDISLTRNYSRPFGAQTASLDRIDNNKGYSIENVQWVHKDVNMMRRKMDIENFVNLCRLVGEHATGKLISSLTE